jgi:hypothetical protein
MPSTTARDQSSNGFSEKFLFDQSEIDGVKSEPMESSGFFIGSTSDPLFPFSFDDSAGARSCVP